MARDLAMIFSVLLSIGSVGFGLYKNIEAGNARGFAYEQSYRVMNAVQQSDIGTTAKANILDAALGVLTTPPPVLDLSRSSADQPEPEVCTEPTRILCADLATRLGLANAACERAKDATCAPAVPLKRDILVQGCFACF